MNLRPEIALAFVGVLAACSAAPEAPSPSLSPSSWAAPSATGEPSASSTRAATPSATASASAQAIASPGAAGAPQVWQNWGLATVRVNGLNVRTRPGVSEPLVGDGSGGVVSLNAGDHVLVMGFVDSADGRQWVQIAAQQVGPHGPVVVGWAVAGTMADPWIEGDNSWCPGSGASFETLLRLSGIERMGCYASAPLTFTAQQATIAPDAGLGGVCGAEAVPWLQCDHVNYNWVNRDGGYDWEFRLHFDPATGIAPTGLAREGESRLLLITGHFMDPQATSCAPNPYVTNEDLARYLNCATSFVVEAIE